jgi:hypothetical protein
LPAQRAADETAKKASATFGCNRGMQLVGDRQCKMQIAKLEIEGMELVIFNFAFCDLHLDFAFAISQYS